jgi:hypothetical protein
LNLSGNTIYINNNNQAYLQILDDVPSGGALTVNNNQYHNTTGNSVVFCKNGDCRNYSGWKTAFGLDAVSSYLTAGPTNPWVYVRPNQYDSGRAHIIVYNWGQASTVNVQVSGVLQVGDSFEVRDVQNYFGTPVFTGIYNGSALPLPMRGLTVAAPVGLGFTPAHTGPVFNVFVLIKK